MHYKNYVKLINNIYYIEVNTMNKYSVSIVLVFSMIFSLLVLSVKKVQALRSDLNAPYKYTYSATIHFENESLSQRIAKTACCELQDSKCISPESNNQFCYYGGLYGGLYGGIYGRLGLYGGY